MKLDQADLAERVGVHGVSMSRYETGERDTPLPVAARIAEVFERTIDSLWRGALTSSVIGADHHQAGETPREVIKMPELDPDAAILALEFMKVPTRARALAYGEARALLERHQRRHQSEDHAEGDQ